MTEYLQFQTIIQFRVPIDGGQPEVLKKFTTEFKGSHATKKVPKKVEFGGAIDDEVVL